MGNIYRANLLEYLLSARPLLPRIRECERAEWDGCAVISSGREGGRRGPRGGVARAVKERIRSLGSVVSCGGPPQRGAASGPRPRSPQGAAVSRLGYRHLTGTAEARLRSSPGLLQENETCWVPRAGISFLFKDEYYSPTGL